MDLRRGLVDEGNVPAIAAEASEGPGEPRQPLRQAGEETRRLGEVRSVQVRTLNGNRRRTLFFVDSITSYDDRMQAIGRASAAILTSWGRTSAFSGRRRRDSGHDVRRFGEESLFLALRDHNSEAIRPLGSAAASSPPTRTPSTPCATITRGLAAGGAHQPDPRAGSKSGGLRFKPVADPDEVYTYHDPATSAVTTEFTTNRAACWTPFRG